MRHRGGRHGFAATGDEVLGQRDHFDHALVSLARILAVGNDAVLTENEPLARLIALEDFDGFFRQTKARHDVRDKTQALA